MTDQVFPDLPQTPPPEPPADPPAQEEPAEAAGYFLFMPRLPFYSFQRIFSMTSPFSLCTIA